MRSTTSPELPPTSPLSFEALALHSSDQRRLSGCLQLESQQLLFVHQDLAIELPITQLQLRRGGANNSLIFLSATSQPEWTISCRQPQILDALSRRYSSPELRQQLVLLAKSKRQRRLFGLASLCAVLFACFLLWQLKDPLVGVVTRQVPLSWEEKIGQVVFQQLTLGKEIIQQPELNAELNSLARPLLAILEEQGFKPSLHIVRADEINAAALPGGKVLVHTGLLLRANRAEEALGVIAHEMAHVSERHVMRGMVSGIGLYFAFDLLLGNIAGVLAAASEAAPLLLQQSFSRDLEREADARGWEFLIQANIDPTGMADFFRVLAEEEAKLPELVQSAGQLLSTHPATQERIQRLTEMQSPAGQQFTDFSLAFDGFKAKLRAELEKR
jgi:predicted Zn-dependent protease